MTIKGVITGLSAQNETKLYVFDLFDVNKIKAARAHRNYYQGARAADAAPAFVLTFL
jgi:hypothetical protein